MSAVRSAWEFVTTTRAGFVVLAAFVVAVLAAVNAGCSTGAAADEPTVTDPRAGAVKMYGDAGIFWDQVEKRCDGTTLLYLVNDGEEGGLAAIPNSPECAP